MSAFLDFIVGLVVDRICENPLFLRRIRVALLRDSQESVFANSEIEDE